MHIYNWQKIKIREDAFCWERLCKDLIKEYRIAFINKIEDEYLSTIFLHNKDERVFKYNGKDSSLEVFLIREKDLDVLKFKTDLYLYEKGYNIDFLKLYGGKDGIGRVEDTGL